MSTSHNSAADFTNHAVVSRDAWLAARKQLLAEEKAFTQARETLAERRRALPWVEVTQRYQFETPAGKATLPDLFDGRSQLIVFHLMFGPDSAAACRGCSFWADNYNGIVEHLKHRDVSFVAVSRAPLPKLQAFANRLGWTFNWVSAIGDDFNHDFGVYYRPDEVKQALHNYGTATPHGTDQTGVSVLARRGDAVYHTYSTYMRGIDPFNVAYQYLDIVPKGRDEAAESPTSWLKHRDSYQ